MRRTQAAGSSHQGECGSSSSTPVRQVPKKRRMASPDGLEALAGWTGEDEGEDDGEDADTEFSDDGFVARGAGGVARPAAAIPPLSRAAKEDDDDLCDDATGGLFGDLANAPASSAGEDDDSTYEFSQKESAPDLLNDLFWRG